MASGQFGCGRNKDMRLAPARRLHSTFRCLHAKLGSSWTMRPILSPSTTSLTTAPSSTPSQNVPSLGPYGLSSILVSMMAEETRPLWPSVLWGWDDRDPLTADGSLWTLTPPLLTPLLSHWSCLISPWPLNCLCLCRGVGIPASQVWQGGHWTSMSSDLQPQYSCPRLLMIPSTKETTYIWPKLIWINQNMLCLLFLFSPPHL